MYSQDFINKSINRQLQIQFNDLFYIERMFIYTLQPTILLLIDSRNLFALKSETFLSPQLYSRNTRIFLEFVKFLNVPFNDIVIPYRNTSVFHKMIQKILNLHSEFT